MSDLHIQTIEGAEGIRILKLEGPLTLNTLFEFQALVRKDEFPRLILDLSSVPYMDSAGLGSLLQAYTARQRPGKGFALANVSSRILTLLQVSKVDTIVPRYESVEAAEAQWKGISESA
jgi:anti-anti-sigma factor